MARGWIMLRKYIKKTDNIYKKIKIIGQINYVVFNRAVGSIEP